MSNNFEMDEELRAIDYQLLYNSERNEPDSTLNEMGTEDDTKDPEQRCADEGERGVAIDWGPEGFMAPRLSYKDRTFDVLTRPSLHQADSRSWCPLQDDDAPRGLMVVGARFRDCLTKSESALWEAFTQDTAIAVDDVAGTDQSDDATGVDEVSPLFPPRRRAPPRSRPASASSFSPHPAPSAAPCAPLPLTSPPLSTHPPPPPHEPFPLPKFPPRSRAPFPSPVLDRALTHLRGNRIRWPIHPKIYDGGPASDSCGEDLPVDVFCLTGTTYASSAPATTTAAPKIVSTTLNTPSTPRLQALKGGYSEDTSNIADNLPELLAPMAKGPQPHHLFVPAWVYAARVRDTEVFDSSVYYYFQHNRWPNFAELPERFQVDCLRTNTAPDAYQKSVEGFAPVWMFVLNRLGEEKRAFRKLFLGCVAGFFESGSFPPSYIFPKQLQEACAHLGVDENDFYEEEGFPQD